MAKTLAKVDAAWIAAEACWAKLASKRRDLDDFDRAIERMVDLYTARIYECEAALEFCAGIDAATGKKLTPAAHAKRLARDNGKTARKALRGRLLIGGVTSC